MRRLLLLAAVGGLVLVLVLVVASGGDGRGRASAPPQASAPPAAPDDLDHLALLLRGDDRDRRVDAAVALREKGASAVPAFIDLLRNGDAHGRALAARSLAKMGRAAADAFPALVEALDDPELRLLAVEALEAIRNRDAIGPLLSLLGERDPDLVVAVLNALAMLRPDTPEAALAIAALLDPPDGRATDRAALCALEAMGPAALPALPTLLATLECDRLRSPAIVAIGAIGPGAASAVPALVAVIVDVNVPEEQKRAGLAEVCNWGPFPDTDARRALAKIGEPALPEVLAMIAHSSPGVRTNGQTILAEMGDAAIPHLVGAARSADPLVRLAVAGAMGNHAGGHPELIDVLARLANDPDPAVRKSAIGSLGSFGEPAGPVVAACLDEEDAGILVAALHAFSRTSPRTGSDVPRIVRLLHHKEPQVRWYAASALASMGEAAAPGLPALAACLGDECPYMRQTTVEAFAKLGRDALPALLLGLDRAPPDAQQGALALLAAEKELHGDALDACKRMLAAASEETRVHAAVALAVHGSRDGSLLPILVAGLTLDDKGTRIEAGRGIAAMGDAAASALTEILLAAAREGEREWGRGLPIDALAAAGRGDPDALVRALSDESWASYAAGFALKQIGEAAVPALSKVLADGPVELRRKAADILGASVQKSAAARAALEAACKDPEVRFDAVWALDFGGSPQAVVPGYIEEALAGSEHSLFAASRLEELAPNAAFALRELRAARDAAKSDQVRGHLARAVEAIENR